MTKFITKNKKVIPLKFRIGDRVITKEQISENVLSGDKGTVIGLRKNKKQSGVRFIPTSVKVEFDSFQGNAPDFVDPTSLNKTKEPRRLKVGFNEEFLIKKAQENTKNIGRVDHDLLVKIEKAQKELKQSKGDPKRQKLLTLKIKKLENRKTRIGHLS